MDGPGSVGQYASIALDPVSGLHASYYDLAAGDLKYARKDATGWHSEIVDSAGDVGKFTSIAVDSIGQCHICYFDVTNGRLKYAHGSSGQWAVAVVDTGPQVGYYISISLDAANTPHIAYSDNGPGQLRYAHFVDGTWQRQIIDSSPSVGRYCSLALDSAGRPHISYQDYQNWDLKYARYDGAGWQVQTVESQNNVGGYTSLQLDNLDRPHIAHYDSTNLALRYAYYDGDNWHPQNVDSSGNVGRFCSLGLSPSGWPCTAYQDYDNRDLKFAVKDTYGWHITTLDGPDYVGWYTSLVVSPLGNVSVAYFDDTNDDLKVITGEAPADTTPPSIPSVVDEGYYTASHNSLHASWSAYDGETLVTSYSYSVGSSPGNADVLDWSAPANITTAALSNLTLAPGGCYYFNVRACNAAGLWSGIGSSNGIRVVTPVAAPQNARLVSDGEWVLLEDQIVTASSSDFGSFIYVRDSNKLSGIKVDFGSSPATSTQRGQHVTVAGRLTMHDGERCIADPFVAPGQLDNPPIPSGLSAKVLTAEEPAVQKPVTIGLLARIVGRFVQLSPTSFAVEDGSGVYVDFIAPNSIVLNPTWHFVAVTGISSCSSLGGSHRVLRLRDQNDLVPID